MEFFSKRMTSFLSWDLIDYGAGRGAVEGGRGGHFYFFNTLFKYFEKM